MKSLENVYYEMKKSNIIDNKDLLNEILDVYKKSPLTELPINSYNHNLQDGEKEPATPGMLYDFLVDNKDSRVYDNSNFNQDDYNEFFTKMTNKWMQKIISLDTNNPSYIQKQNLNKYILIKNILPKYGNVNTAEKAQKMYSDLKKQFDKQEADNTFNNENLFWAYYQTNMPDDYSKAFVHVNSLYTTKNKEEFIKHDYRLYINPANKDLFKLINRYVDYCDERHMEYYFKYSVGSQRRDKLLFYISKEQLADNIDILSKIAKEYPEIKSNCGPRIKLTGNIDNWIGLASEPNRMAKKKYNYSFNTLAAQIFDDAADTVTLNFIMSNIDKNIELDGKTLKFNNLVLDSAINTLKKNASPKTDIQKKYVNSPQYISDMRNKLLGYSCNYTTFTGKKLNNIMAGFYRMQEYVFEKNELSTLNPKKTIFKYYLPEDEIESYNLDRVGEVVKSFVDIMKKCDPEYINKFKDEIAKGAIKYGIDPNNFSLNATSLSDFKEIDKVNKNKEDLLKKYDSNTKKIEYIRGALSMLSDEEQRTMIPINNTKVTLNQYVQENLVDKIDDNYNFGKDNDAIPISKLIRNLAGKYSDGKIINKDSKNTNFSIDSVINEINSKKVTDDNLHDKLGYVRGALSMLSDEEQSVMIPINNTKVTLNQYAQENLADKIDDNYNFVLNNGMRIPASSIIKSSIEKYSSKETNMKL